MPSNLAFAPNEEIGEIFSFAPQVAPQEIRSGALWPDPNLPGCYCIDANTASGRRRFRYAWEESKWRDAQSQEDCEPGLGMAIVMHDLKSHVAGVIANLQSLSVEWHRAKVKRGLECCQRSSC